MNAMIKRTANAKIPFAFLPKTFRDNRLIPIGIKKKKGKMRRRVLILRGDYLSMGYSKL
jgi:hypothetical protein